MTTRKKSTLKLTQLGILFALVIVLQSVSSFGVINICLCLVPITLGAMLFNWKGGLALGVAFGAVAVLWGIVGKDVFTMYLFQANPIMTILICILKGAAAGVVPALVYGLLIKCNCKDIVAAVIASISAPIANTGVFTIGCLLIKEDIINVSSTLGLPVENFVYLLFAILIGTNFFVELAVNAIFSPALGRLVKILKKDR